MPGTVREVIAKAWLMLDRVEVGAARAQGSDPDQREPGLHDVSVYGRAITNVLENLRGTGVDFDTWYRPWKEELEADPLCRYFYKTRSAVLKEGSPVKASGAITIGDLQLPRDLSRFGPPPPGAHGFLIDGRWGKGFWEVTLPDGREDRVPMQLPAGVASSTVYLQDAPGTHLGRPLTDRSVGALCGLYRDYLRRLVDSAAKTFLP